MQAYAEGFDILTGAKGAQLPESHRYDLNVADIAELWRRGSVVGSWLLDLTASALAENPSLSNFTGSEPGGTITGSESMVRGPRTYTPALIL